MIIVNCRNFLQGAISIRSLYINICNYELNNLVDSNSLGLFQILDKYNINEIKEAINSITISNNYLIVPEQTKASVILRYLEYGGEDIKAIHFLSKAKSKLYNTFSSKGDRLNVL